LAILYQHLSRYEEAEPLYKHAIEIYEYSQDRNVARWLYGLALLYNNLAILYQHLSRYEEAEPLYQWALGIFEKALGPEHPNVATCLENYASLLRSMGRPEKAEPLQARAMEIRAKRPN
jgi:tetratricopeptide (TPR) repeat protein